MQTLSDEQMIDLLSALRVTTNTQSAFSVDDCYRYADAAGCIRHLTDVGKALITKFLVYDRQHCPVCNDYLGLWSRREHPNLADIDEMFTELGRQLGIMNQFLGWLEMSCRFNAARKMRRLKQG